MPRLARLGLSLAIFFCLPIPDAEAALNKCTDGKQITYTTDPCEKTGLTSAGPIKEAVTVMPATRTPLKDSTEKPGTREEKEEVSGNQAPMNDDSGADTPKETTTKPAKPLAKKMLDW